MKFSSVGDVVYRMTMLLLLVAAGYISGKLLGVIIKLLGGV
jgi:hypothetical protein